MAHSTTFLFLDFDGVLHPYGTDALSEDFKLLDNPALFEFLPVLEALLAPHPAVQIIVSSDWRRLFDDAALIAMLGNVGGRFAGVVEHYNSSRVEEIQAEAARRQATAWVAVDDHPTVASASQQDWRFVATHPARGLSDPAIQAVLEKALQRLTAAPA